MKNSLKKNREFQNVFEKRDSRANKYLVMYKKENGTNESRMGISVSRKVGNSVERHRLTRILREIFRLNRKSFETGYDFVLVVRKAAGKQSYQELEKAFLHVAELHHVVNGES